MARFRADRRAKLRAEWHQVAGVAAVCLASVSLAVILGGTPGLIFAAVAGGAFMTLCVFWVVGDVRSLRWAWGAVGEEQTADVLARLGRGWSVIHDVPTVGGANWDHVVIGRPGVFLIETKSFTGVARAQEDALRVGRLRFEGGALRAAAASLSDALGVSGAARPWVQAVVVTWGDFPQRRHIERNVVYLHNTELIPWLTGQTGRLADARVAALTEAVSALSKP